MGEVDLLKMNYIIITGASRGLGSALARRLISPGNHLFCIARKINHDLINIAQEMCVPLEFLGFDLTNIVQIPLLMNELRGKIDKSAARRIFLINNAGTVAPVTTIDNCDSQGIINNISLNLTAPVLLTSEFIKHFLDWEIERRIVNISSGAGKKPYYGWSCYCSAKAALDMFTRCAGIEQECRRHPIKICSVAPGIIDTDMQEEIRSSSPEDFIQVERFINFKEEGKLLSADYVAGNIIELLFTGNFENGGVIDIRGLTP